MRRSDVLKATLAWINAARKSKSATSPVIGGVSRASSAAAARQRHEIGRENAGCGYEEGGAAWDRHRL
jgi:hypothetical protein